MVARAIQHHMVNTGDKPELMPLPKNVDKVVCYAVEPTLTRVKVYMADQGVRTWNIRLIEQKRQTDDDKS
jgi:hypothetical protein